MTQPFFFSFFFSFAATFSLQQPLPNGFGSHLLLHGARLSVLASALRRRNEAKLRHSSPGYLCANIAVLASVADQPAVFGATALVASFGIGGNISTHRTFDGRRGCGNPPLFICKSARREGIPTLRVRSPSFRIQDVALSLSTCLAERPFNFSPC